MHWSTAETLRFSRIFIATFLSCYVNRGQIVHCRCFILYKIQISFNSRLMCKSTGKTACVGGSAWGGRGEVNIFCIFRSVFIRICPVCAFVFVISHIDLPFQPDKGPLKPQCRSAELQDQVMYWTFQGLCGPVVTYFSCTDSVCLHLQVELLSVCTDEARL